MHMADALISPLVGGTMIVSTVSVVHYATRKINIDEDEKKIPLMGVMGAFVFAAQMINFTIPGTGSSGHIGGGVLLAILLGPYAGFMTLASVLLIQALFFGDGGLLAFGCNAINLGFFSCFVAYPLIYKNIIGKNITRKKIIIASMLSGILALQLGSLGVVFETLLSGKTELPFLAFIALMQPIHFAIAIGEGLVTAGVVIFIWQARPELLGQTSLENKRQHLHWKNVLGIIGVMTLFIGGFLSWFASSNPDGLEWSVFNVTGQEDLQISGRIYDVFRSIQNATAILPDYAFRESVNIQSVYIGTSFSGIIGGALTVVLVVIIGVTISLVKKKQIGLKVKKGFNR